MTRARAPLAVVTGLGLAVLTCCAAAPGPTGSTASGPAATSTTAASAATPAPAASASGSASAAAPATPAPPAAPPAGDCSPDPMAHVYNPDRLHVLAACVTVSGTVELIRAEPDGDYHVRIALDPGQLCAGRDCLDDSNRSDQSGDLVVEPVCLHTVTQSDAVSACIGYHNLLTIPPVGSHATITGPWVLDADHGWQEIHPVESFGAAPAAPPGAATPTAAATAPAGTAPLSVTITASTYGHVAAQTAAGASCTARATLPSGRTSTASGLQSTQTAGPDGAVAWTYGTSSSTRPGTGTHTVTCTLGGVTASASAPFTVS